MKEILRRVEKLAADNSPTILTAVGVTGTISTAVLAARASFQAKDILIAAQAWQDMQELGHELDRKEKFELVWKVYIPAASTGMITVVAIIMANRIGHRRAAAVAAAFSISQEAFTEYREKVIEKLGEKPERAVRDGIAQDQVRRDPPKTTEVIITDNGDVLCRDAFSGRYFKSNVESIRKAVNDLNQQILGFGYASLTEFYILIGLDRTSISDEVGWQGKMITAEFSAAMTEDNKPCMVLNYSIEPVRDYYRFS
jgi:hypothetical protein